MQGRQGTFASEDARNGLGSLMMVNLFIGWREIPLNLIAGNLLKLMTGIYLEPLQKRKESCRAM